MNIYHFVKQLDELLSPEGFVMAEADDPGLCGLEDNEAAWYDPETGGFNTVTVNDDSIVVQGWTVDGEMTARTAWPRPVDAEVVAANVVGDV